MLYFKLYLGKTYFHFVWEIQLQLSKFVCQEQQIGIEEQVLLFCFTGTLSPFQPQHKHKHANPKHTKPRNFAQAEIHRKNQEIYSQRIQKNI